MKDGSPVGGEVVARGGKLSLGRHEIRREGARELTWGIHVRDGCWPQE